MGTVDLLERPPPPGTWGLPHSWGEIPEFGDYGVLVATAKAKPDPVLAQRRRDFGDVVRRTYDAARARGMTVTEMEEATDIGSSTWYGWMDGRWTRDPSPAKVNAFFDGLGASREDAYRALRWETAPTPRRKHPTPVVEDPDIRALMRKLTSAKTSPAEKLLIRRTIRALIGTSEETPPNP